jgi:hypothetical protein
MQVPSIDWMKKKILWVVNKKRKVWFDFWGRGEIGFFWGKKRKI